MNHLDRRSDNMEQRIYDIADYAKSEAEQPVKTPVFSTDSINGVVWVIRPGQTLAKHAHDHSVDVWICLQGEGVFYPAPTEQIPFRAGQIVVNRKGDCHGATNTGTEDIVFVGVLAPVPSDYRAIDERR